MVSGLISLITRLFLLLILIGCSSSYKKKSSKPTVIKKKSYQFGPTQSSSSFIESASKYGLEGIQAVNFYAVDFNNDGYTDLVTIPKKYSSPNFYLFDSDTKKFVYLKDSPLDRPVQTSFLVFTDLNNDRILDMVVGYLNQKSESSGKPLRIFQGKLVKGVYSLAKVETNFEVGLPTSTIIPLDFDLDGDLDLFVGNWFTKFKRNPMPMRDYLFENKGNFNFTDQTSRLGKELEKKKNSVFFSNSVPTYSASICDFDGDRFPEILTGSSARYSNKLWWNKKTRRLGRQFRDVGKDTHLSGDTEALLTQRGGGRTFSVLCEDYNNDSTMDVFVGELTHSYDSDDVDKSSILTNVSLKFPYSFYRTEYMTDANTLDWHQGDKRGNWFDFNNDGLVDLMVDNSGFPPYSRLLLFEQLPDHAFQMVSPTMGVDILNPRSSIYVDFNQDGKLDILTSQSNERNKDLLEGVLLYENQIEHKNKFLKIRLQGKESNTYGVGAWIYLRVSSLGRVLTKKKYVQWSQGGFPPQTPSYTHFGIKEGEEIIDITVLWPSMKKDPKRKNFKRVYKLSKPGSYSLCEDGRKNSFFENCYY